MKTLAVVLSLMICAPASAEELTASLLYSTCLDKEYLPSQQLCRFYILGAVQGLEYGDEAVRLTNPLILKDSKTPEFLIPHDDVANRAGRRACASRLIGWNWFMIF